MKPNILFFMVDSVRADRFFGDKKTSVTPNIDKLISSGIYFNQTIGPADSTIISLASMFTGKHPFKTGIRSNRLNKLNPNLNTIFKVLEKNGYCFYGHVPKAVLSTGLLPRFENSDNFYDLGYDLFDGLGDCIFSKFENNSLKEPWCFFIHPHDLHFPIVVPKSFNDKKYGVNNYDKQLSAIDFWIGKIISKINLKNTLIIFISDHGTYLKSVDTIDNHIDLEVNGNLQIMTTKLGNKIPHFLNPLKMRVFFFLESIRKKRKTRLIKNFSLKPHEKRGLLIQRGDLDRYIFDDHVHIPFLLTGYGISDPKIISDMVRTVDVFPTLMKILNMPFPANDLDGRDLTPLIKGESMDEKPAYMESAPLIQKKSNNVIGVRTSKFKYFRDREDPKKRIFLFNLEQDPNEDQNIAKSNPVQVEEMEKILQEILSSNNSNIDKKFNEEETKLIEEKLKKLGYI